MCCWVKDGQALIPSICKKVAVGGFAADSAQVILLIQRLGRIKSSFTQWKTVISHTTGPTLPLLFSRKIWLKKNSKNWMQHVVQRTQLKGRKHHSHVLLSATREWNRFHKHSVSLAPAILLCVRQTKLRIEMAVRTEGGLGQHWHQGVVFESWDIILWWWSTG